MKTICLLILMILVLCNPVQTCNYAFQGLSQWATRMVPTLFPFMMLSSLMLCCGADKQLGGILSTLLKPFLKLSHCGLYAVFIGFLCGFPMGAKIVSELYTEGKISKQEAEILLGFCNNIGPAYFLGLILPMLHACGYTQKIPFLIGMYGLPLIYGIFLSHFNRDRIIYTAQNEQEISMNAAGIFRRVCMDNIQSILILGGYVTFINAFRVTLDYLPLSAAVRSIAGSFLEIIGGIQAIYITPMPEQTKTFWIMTALCFGGLSCMLQTSCFLGKSKLSMLLYIKHKMILTFLSAAYYFFILRTLSH